jgi:hypothetical protein
MSRETAFRFLIVLRIYSIGELEVLAVCYKVGFVGFINRRKWLLPWGTSVGEICMFDPPKLFRAGGFIPLRLKCAPPTFYYYCSLTLE